MFSFVVVEGGHDLLTTVFWLELLLTSGVFLLTILPLSGVFETVGATFCDLLTFDAFFSLTFFFLGDGSKLLPPEKSESLSPPPPKPPKLTSESESVKKN